MGILNIQCEDAVHISVLCHILENRPCSDECLRGEEFQISNNKINDQVFTNLIIAKSNIQSDERLSTLSERDKFSESQFLIAHPLFARVTVPLLTITPRIFKKWQTRLKNWDAKYTFFTCAHAFSAFAPFVFNASENAFYYPHTLLLIFELNLIFLVSDC